MAVGGSELRVVATDLDFPEGPVAMPDGSVIVVEMFGECLTRVHPDGTKERVAELPGGPNGAALGPNGLMYICNNGGRFSRHSLDGTAFVGPPTNYTGGRIQTVDLETGAVEDLYTDCGGSPLWSPNDLVFDAHGGFYFTDVGYEDITTRVRHLSGIHYARADGSAIDEVVFPVHTPNGIGISPDGQTLYWAETHSGRVHQREIVSPGRIRQPDVLDAAACLFGFSGLQLLDSLAVDSAGNVCVGTVIAGGISVVSPMGELIDFVATGDPVTTNICFGGPGLTTAYITASGTGALLAMEWRVPGLKLNHFEMRG